MAQSKTEFELKLTGARGDVARVPGLALFDAIAAAPGEFARLVSTYCDAPDERLAKAGASLRIRDEAATRTLCVKVSPPGASPVFRLESERLLGADDDAMKTGVAEIDRLIGETGDLEPIARTTTDRWSRFVETGGALIEVSAEIGSCERLIDPPATGSLAEVELELLKGDPAALFDLAGRIMREFDGRLRIDVRSKLERAMRAGVPLSSRKARREKLDADARAGDVLGAALKQCAHQIADAAARAAEGHDADAVRQLRVAFRRLRAVEKIFRGALDGGALEPLATKARDLARVVGNLRDVDLFIDTSLPLNDEPRMRARLDAVRAQRRLETTTALTSAEFAAFTIELFRAAWVENWRGGARKRLETPAADFAKAMLASLLDKLLAAGAAADFGDPPGLHPLRLDLKRFRYAAQFFRDFFPVETRAPFFATMSALQTALGAVNDAVVAARIADAAGEGQGAASMRAAGFVAGYRTAEAAATARDAETIWSALAAAPRYWVDPPPTDDP